MMRRAVTTSILLLSAFACFASGWRDYTLDIGDGYYIFRANSMDVCVGKADHGLILYPDKFANVGPVVRYITTPQHILTRNLGRKSRNLFQGDTFQDVDPSQTFFFVISKGTDEIVGPLSEDEFTGRPEVASLGQPNWQTPGDSRAASLGQLNWQTPKNPNFWLPLLGGLMFLAFAIPILAVKFFWITIPATIGMVLLVMRVRARRGGKPQPKDRHGLPESTPSAPSGKPPS
jgi:hypothetical protein